MFTTNYVKKSLIKKDEEILYQAYISKWILLIPFLSFLFFIFSAIKVDIFFNFNENNNFLIGGLNLKETLQILFLIPAFVSFIFLIKNYIYIISTEIIKTNQRVIVKTGLLNIKTEMMPLDRIESIDIEQSFIGRIFNFGNIIIKGVGDGLIHITDVSNPNEFVQN